MKKVKSFSTLEISVALLLSGVLVSIAYSGFGYLTKQYFRNDEKSTAYAEINRLNALLKKDFLMSEKIMGKGEKLEIKYKDKNTVYVFDQYILRTQAEVTDTFHVEPETYTYGFSGQEQFISGGLVDELQLHFTYKSRTFTAVFSKTYGTDELLKTELIHGH